MHKTLSSALGVALVAVTALAAAACDRREAPDPADRSAAGAAADVAAAERSAPGASESAQTTPATQPVVTVYKSPT